MDVKFSVHLKHLEWFNLHNLGTIAENSDSVHLGKSGHRHLNKTLDPPLSPHAHLHTHDSEAQLILQSTGLVNGKW